MDEDLYHQRTLSETAFSPLKDDGEKLRSRSWHGQFRELTRKCIVHKPIAGGELGLAACSLSGRIRQRHRRHPRTGSHKVT